MTLEQLFDLVLDRTGEFLIGADNVELNLERFETIVAKSLKTYSKYKPLRKKLSITLTDYKYTFTDETGIPFYISDVNPSYSTLFNPLLSAINNSSIPFIDWEYKPPTLYTNFDGDAEVEAWFYHEIRTDDLGNKHVDLDDELFIDLVTAEFLIGLGRSRRAFKLESLPVTNDAEILTSEGLKLYEDTIEALRQSSTLL